MPARLQTPFVASIKAAGERYVCPSCSFQQRARVQRNHHSQTLRASKHQGEAANALATRLSKKPSVHKQSIATQNWPTRRNASTSSLASSTAINPPSHVPPRYQDIHAKLVRLSADASGFADLARLRLSIKSYETAQPGIRVAFLSLDGASALAARRLARALLSDALGTEQAWEQQLERAGQDGRSILIRYGQADDLTGSSTLFNVLSVPSPLLEQYKLEILIAPFLSGSQEVQQAVQDVEDALLVPALTIPNAGGRVGFVRNPVHKTLVIVSGIDDIVRAGQLGLPLQDALMALVVDGRKSTPDSTGRALEVDVDLACTAIANFRRSGASGADFGDAWLESKVTEVREWLTASLASNEHNIQDIYLASTLHAIDRSIDQTELAQIDSATQATIPDVVRNDIDTAVSEWSANAHQDLRDNLIAAFESRAWKRTSWLRLLWRTDDVSYSTSDILNQCWLNQTEQRLAYLSGRIRQAGLASETAFADTGMTLKAVVESKEEEVALEAYNEAGEKVVELVQSPVLFNKTSELKTPPWPQAISNTRQYMLEEVVPAMHRNAQSLVLSTLTTAGGMSALGAWWWVASGGTAFYEAGSLIALGLAWSFRRLQRKWGAERDAFAQNAQEDGRRVLAEIESRLRERIRYGGRTEMRADDIESFAKARSAVEACREALQALKK